MLYSYVHLLKEGRVVTSQLLSKSIADLEMDHVLDSL